MYLPIEKDIKKQRMTETKRKTNIKTKEKTNKERRKLTLSTK